MKKRTKLKPFEDESFPDSYIWNSNLLNNYLIIISIDLLIIIMEELAFFYR